MKKLAKRAAALLLAVVLTFSLAGCSGGDLTWSVRTDDAQLPVGVYIYYLSIAYNEASGQVSTDEKVLDAEIDGMAAEDWIVNRAQDNIRKLLWMDSEMARLGLKLSDDDLNQAAILTTSYWNMYGGDETFGEYGIARSSVDRAYSQYNLKYLKVFEALYGAGGEKEVSGDEMLKYHKDNCYTVEYFTVPLAVATESGSPTYMTEDQIELLEEELEGFKKEIEAGKKTLEEVALQYAGTDKVEDSAYCKDTNTLAGFTNDYLPFEFTDTLAEMKDNEIEILNADNYLTLMRRLPLEEEIDGGLAYDLLTEMKRDEFSEYVSTSAKTFDDFEMNENAAARYTPKMFAQGDLVNGASSAASEESSEEAAE